MIRKTVALLSLCLLVAELTLGQNTTSQNAGVAIFSIDKKPVMTDEFLYLFRKNNSKPEEFTQAKIDEYLNLLINFKLKVEEAKHLGMDTTAAFRKEYNTYREELRKPYLPDSKLVDSLVAITYKRMQEEIHAAHILVNLKPDATPEDTLAAYKNIMSLRERALNGDDFGKLAAENSEDPSAKSNHGDLGYFTAMQMVFPFEQAAYQTSVGEISMPIRTRFGYHIVKTIDRRPARGEVEVSHIMLRTGEGYDNDKAKNTIFDIYDQLQKGVSWTDLCKEYSQDPSSKDNGGKLRPFGVGVMSAVPEFEKIAFSLKRPGDISDPFQTQYGWHIMKLESKIPLPSFNEISTSLKTRVSRDERVQISRHALENKLRKDLGFTENPGVKSKVLSLADSTLKKGKWKPAYSLGATNETLFTLQLKSYTALDFIKYVEQNQKSNALEPHQYLQQLYDQYLSETQGLALEENIKKKNPDYGWLLKEYYEGILLFEIMEKKVWNKATEDSIGQLKFYKSHANQYQAGERVRGKIFSAPLPVLQQLKEIIEKGDSVKLQEFVSHQKIRQESGAYEKDDRPVLSKINWSPGLFFAENNGQHYLVWIKTMVPPGVKSFDEARPSVISDYQNDLEKRWLEELKKKYKVKIDKKGKEYVMKQLLRDKV